MFKYNPDDGWRVQVEIGFYITWPSRCRARIYGEQHKDDTHRQVWSGQESKLRPSVWKWKLSYLDKRIYCHTNDPKLEDIQKKTLYQLNYEHMIKLFLLLT